MDIYTYIYTPTYITIVGIHIILDIIIINDDTFIFTKIRLIFYQTPLRVENSSFIT